MIFLGRTFDSIPRHGEMIEPHFELVVFFDNSSLSEEDAMTRAFEIKDRLPVFYKRISFVFSDGKLLFPYRFAFEITPDTIVPINQARIRQDLKLLKQAEHARQTLGPLALQASETTAWLYLLSLSLFLSFMTAGGAFFLARYLQRHS